eukprot:9070688-Pyramimonas_sp.AAC.1
MNFEEVAGGSRLPMGPVPYVTNPSGSAETSNCRHFWAPQARVLRKSQAGASSVSELRGNPGGKPIPMGLALYARIRGGSSATCICRHFWAPRA